MSNEYNAKVVEDSKPKRKRSAPLGVRVKRDMLKVYKKLVASVPNPDIILQKMNKDLSEYRKITYDPHVSSCIQSRKSGVLSMDWEIQSENSNSEVTLFIDKVIKSLNIRNIISEILDAPLFGHTIHEIYWQEKQMPTGELKVIPKDIVALPQEWFTFDSNNLLRPKSANGKDEQPLKNNKFILVQSGASFNNPYGQAILAKCFWAVHWKNNGFDLYFRYLEKFGIPRLHGKVSSMSELDDEIENEIYNKLDELNLDGIAVTSSDVEINLLSAAGTVNTDVYKNLILMCNAEISKAILSQTLTTEQGDTGSYAMSQTHLQVRKDVVDSDKKLVEDAFNKLIDLMVEYNFGKVSDKPRFVMYAQNEIDLTLADRDTKLLATNQIKFTQEYWKRNYGFKDDEFQVVNPQPTFEEADIPEPQPTKKQVSNKIIQDALDKAITNQLIKDGKDFNANLDKVYAFIEGTASYEDALGTIADLYDELDTESLKRKMEQIMFVSDVIGRLSVNQLVGE